MLEFDEESEIEINIYKWKNENRIDIEIEYGGMSPFEITVYNMTDVNNFLKAIKKAKITKYKVDSDGGIIE